MAALAEKLPRLMINQALEHPVCDEVVADERLGVRLLFEHLYDLGHRRIAFVGSDLTSDAFSEATPHFHERAHSFRETAIDLGVFGDGALFRPLFRPQLTGRDNGRDFFKNILAKLLALPESPTAIVAYNDVQALAIMHDAHALDIKIPEQLSLVGFDNIPAALPWDVALTTVDPNFKTQADIAVSLLLSGNEHAGDREQVRILCRPKLVVGETTMPPTGKQH